MLSTSSNNSGPLQKSISPLLQYKSSEQVYPTHEATDEHSNKFTTDREEFANVNHISDSKLQHQSRDTVLNSKPEQKRVGKVSEHMVEQARHDRRASERKLRKSQKLVNRLFSDNGDAYKDEADPQRKRVQIADDGPEIIDDYPPSPVNDWFEKSVDSPEPPQLPDARKEKVPQWNRAISPTGGTNFRTVSIIII